MSTKKPRCTARKHNPEGSDHRCRRIKGHKGKHKCVFDMCLETEDGDKPLEWSTSSTRARR